MTTQMNEDDNSVAKTPDYDLDDNSNLTTQMKPRWRRQMTTQITKDDNPDYKVHITTPMIMQTKPIQT
jgi:hypothetical protein